MSENEAKVLVQIEREEARFLKTIAAGQGELKKIMVKAKAEGSVIPGPRLLCTALLALCIQLSDRA